jgi:hypothetical protein
LDRDIKQMDWSEMFLWSSLVLSATMLSGVLVWNVANAWRISWQLERHGVDTCVALQARGGQAAPGAQARCAALVERLHEQCMDEAVAGEDERFSDTRKDYMTCIMAADTETLAMSDEAH